MRLFPTKYGNLCPKTTDWFTARHENTLSMAIAFVPWIIMQAYKEGTLDQKDVVVAHRGEGAVVFSDASGFTALTERLAAMTNGAELLSQCLTGFFTPLIDMISDYRGDVIKFSGDALTIYFPPFDDTLHPTYNPVVPPHGTYGLRDLGPMATAVLRASACCVEIHRRLHMYETNVDGVLLCLHIGVGCGSVTILQVGGVVPPETKAPRYEYVIAGHAIDQISMAEPLAQSGETCLSPQAWRYAADWAIEGRSLGSEPPECHYHILKNLNPEKYTFPCVRNAAIMRDARHDDRFRLTELTVIQRYIPSNVFKHIENDTLTYANEIRTVSTIFISGSGVDVSTDEGSRIAQELVSDVQSVCYAHEGSLNKFLVDDKGMLFLLVYGLPPMVHTDDPTRAVLACMDIISIFKRMNLVCRCGVTTGRNYCGVVGSARRMEYTVLGDTVNLAARLMANAQENAMLVDVATRSRCASEVVCTALPSIEVKGKSDRIQIYEPQRVGPKDAIGLRPDGSIVFPWPPVSHALGGKSKVLEVGSWDAKHDLQSKLDGIRRKGGVLTISGGMGMGATELTEHVVMDTFRENSAIPVFGTQDCRPGPKFRPIEELLRSVVAACRHKDNALPADDKAALADFANADSDHLLAELGPDLSLASELWYRRDADEQSRCQRGVDFVQRLVGRLLEERPVTCILSIRSGSNVFASSSGDDDEEDTIVWALARELGEMAEARAKKRYPLIVVLAMTHTLETCPKSVCRVIPSDSYIRLEPLSETNIVEYISKSIGLSAPQVPEALKEFVFSITQGNALFIEETIESLVRHGHLKMLQKAEDEEPSLTFMSELESINVADWSTTEMVGGTTCMLESLEPLQTAVVKMATVFDGVFTVADLMASSCSRWTGASFFDAFRLFYAVTILQKRGIIELADNIEGEDFLIGDRECFRFSNMLIQKVGRALVLESQRKTVKRQALIERVLVQFLPTRMEELKRKKAVPHVPWHYQTNHPDLASQLK